MMLAFNDSTDKRTTKRTLPLEEVGFMVKYVSLLNLTPEGIKDIRNAPQRLAEATSGIEAMGGKLLDFYLVQGQYDYVAVTEWPNAEAGMAFLMALGSQGNVRTTTLRAFDLEEFQAIVKKIP